MEAISSVVRPGTLIEGAEYLLLETQGNRHMPTVALVRFVDYTACPAFVVVMDGSNKRVRCLREELFSQQSHTE
jgi:hypothetical protein